MEQKIRKDLSIGPNLRRLREDHGFSQEKLCAELQRNSYNIGRSTYQKYENGKLNIPVRLLRKLKKLYNCTYEDLLD